jgi:hypothetical protein
MSMACDYVVSVEDMVTSEEAQKIFLKDFFPPER